jgi:hypothetical protein
MMPLFVGNTTIMRPCSAMCVFLGLSSLPLQQDSSAQVNGKIYHFQKNAFGDSVVKEFNTADLPPELEPQGTDQFSFSARRNLRPEEHSAEAWRRKLVEARYIDVLVPITRRAYCSISIGSSSTSCKISGSRTDTVEAHIELAFFEANEALSASGVPGRLRLARWFLLNDDTWDELAHSYMDIATNLPRLNNGFLDEVNVMRETHKADLVSIFIDDPSSCGLAYSGYPVPAAYGYSVVNYSCAVGYYSFAHEIAHNLGAKHDRVTSNCSGTSCCGNDCDNFGYRDPDSNYRSILAYNCQAKNCARVQMFSQPDYSLVDANGQSQPIGNEWNDNARVLINNWSTVADYYEGPYDTVVSTPPVEAPVGTPVDTSTPAPTKAPATAVPETLCGNGICEPRGGENCDTCALDCIGGTHWGSQCGNGWCEDGETCDSCPSDCPSRIDEATGNTFCCQGGPLGCIADGALGCNNNICWNNRGCSVDKAIEFSYCCGNGICEPGEAVATCSDCVCVDDGVCETWEDTTNCADCQNQDTAGYNCLEYLKVCQGVTPDPCCNGCGSNGRCI